MCFNMETRIHVRCLVFILCSQGLRQCPAHSRCLVHAIRVSGWGSVQLEWGLLSELCVCLEHTGPRIFGGGPPGRPPHPHVSSSGWASVLFGTNV